METKNKMLIVRLTQKELENIKKYSAEYKSVAGYIRSAVAEFSNVDAKRKLEAMNELSIILKKYQNELSSIGGNLNQAMKRGNELSIAGLLSQQYFDSTLKPYISEAYETCHNIKRELDVLSNYIKQH